MLTLTATLSLDLMSATSHNQSPGDVGTNNATVAAPSASAGVNVEKSTVVNKKPVQIVEERDTKTNLGDDAGSWFTMKNILIATVGLAVLLLVLVLLRNMIRVR